MDTCLHLTHAVTVWWTLSLDRAVSGESAMAACSLSAIYAKTQVS